MSSADDCNGALALVMGTISGVFSMIAIWITLESQSYTLPKLPKRQSICSSQRLKRDCLALHGMLNRRADTLSVHREDEIL
jgi:hypothetical protein